MTNKEWLATLPAEEFYDQLKAIEYDKARWDINSRLYMIDWLDEEHILKDRENGTNENVLEYKGYSADIRYSAKDNVLYGKINGIRDLVSFCSASASEIEKEFQNAVDEYLLLCDEIGKES